MQLKSATDGGAGEKNPSVRPSIQEQGTVASSQGLLCGEDNFSVEREKALFLARFFETSNDTAMPLTSATGHRGASTGKDSNANLHKALAISYYVKVKRYLTGVKQGREISPSPSVSPEGSLASPQGKLSGEGNLSLERKRKSAFFRDSERHSYAAYTGNHPLLSYLAIGENESSGRGRYNLMQNMHRSCGLPSEGKED